MTIREAVSPRTWQPGYGQTLPGPVLRLPHFARDFAFVLSVVGLYFLLRGQAGGDEATAVAVSGRLVAFERWLGLFREPQVQAWSIRWHAVQELANFTYAYLHFPVLALVGAWLWWRDRETFAFVRNVMFISMAIGLVFYYLLPAAPPRLMAAHGHDLGFVDTVFGSDTSVRYAQPSLILNEYAAIPSFHFGWIALAAGAIWLGTPNRALRGLGIGLVALMTWAIVASANHLFVDMALGGLVVGLSWWAAANLPARLSNRGTR